MDSATDDFHQNITECQCETVADPETFNVVHLIFYGILGTSVILFGLIGNILSTLILTSHSTINSHTCHLIALTVWDSVVLISSFLQFSFWVIIDPNATLRQYGSHVHFLTYVYVLINTSMSGSIFALVNITVQRYCAISRPYLSATRFRGNQLRLTMLAVWIFPCLLNIPRFFELEVSSCCMYDTVDSTNYTNVPFLHMSEITTSRLYYSLFRIGVDLLLTYLIPLSTLIVLTILMCRCIRKASENRKAMRHTTENTASDSSANKTLVSVILKFLCCYSLSAMLNVLELLDCDSFGHQIMEIVTVVSNFLIILNSACIFPILHLTSTQFRRDANRLRGQPILNSQVEQSYRLRPTELVTHIHAASSGYGTQYQVDKILSEEMSPMKRRSSNDSVNSLHGNSD